MPTFRRPGDSRYRSDWVAVPVSHDDPSQGTVRVRLADIPAALYPELIATVVDAAQQVRSLADPGKPSTSGARKELLFDQAAALAELVRWGVAGHQPEDFLEEQADGTKTPILWQGEEVEEHGRTYRVTSRETLEVYASVPKSALLLSLHAAIADYQQGRIRTPEEIWTAKTAPAKEEAPSPFEPPEGPKKTP